MKIVIDIPIEHYNEIVYEDVEKLREVIKNGKVLPKEHGDLIDRSKLRLHERTIQRGLASWLEDVYLPEEIENADIVVEASKTVHDIDNTFIFNVKLNKEDQNE